MIWAHEGYGKEVLNLFLDESAREQGRSIEGSGHALLKGRENATDGQGEKLGEPEKSNGRVESINNKIKVTVRMGYGFRNTDDMISLLMLRCSDAKPGLPGRPPKKNKKHHPMKAAA